MSTPLCPQKVLNPKFFYLKNVLFFTTKSIGPQLFWTQNLSSLKLLWAQNFCGTQKFFWTQNSFAPKIFTGKIFYSDPKKISDLKFFRLHFFYQIFLLTQRLFGPYVFGVQHFFFRPKIFMDLKTFWSNICFRPKNVFGTSSPAQSKSYPNRTLLTLALLPSSVPVGQFQLSPIWTEICIISDNYHPTYPTQESSEQTT